MLMSGPVYFYNLNYYDEDPNEIHLRRFDFNSPHNINLEFVADIIDVYQYNYPLMFIDADQGWILLSYDGERIHEISRKPGFNITDSTENNGYYAINLPDIRRITSENINNPPLRIIHEDFPETIIEDFGHLSLEAFVRKYSISQGDDLFVMSYETLSRQLYGLPVIIPEFLVINGLRVNFIPFETIAKMISKNEIERWIIDPLLQPFAGPPGTNYRIFTFFGKNGITYLVKARYNTQTNQILP